MCDKARGDRNIWNVQIMSRYYHDYNVNSNGASSVETGVLSPWVPSYRTRSEDTKELEIHISVAGRKPGGRRIPLIMP